MLVVLISVIVAFLYHKITEYVNNRKIDIVIFLSLLISHFIWNYYFLPIEILIAISGANLLLSFLKKLIINNIIPYDISTRSLDFIEDIN